MENPLNDNKNGEVFLSLGKLAEMLKVELKGDPEVLLSGIGPLESAGPDQLSFLADARHRARAGACRAAALIVPPECGDLERNLLITKNTYLALARAASFFTPGEVPVGDVHDTAQVGEGVQLADTARVGPFVCIGDNARIGERTRICAGAYIGSGVLLGADCLIYPRAVILDNCAIGDRVIIHSGAVIGADGFGYAQDEQGRHVKIPQTGIVQIDEDVEIGANTTIDRATFGRTWIKRGAKIDNLVMIGHNVVVGEDSIFAGQAGIAGSTQVGNHVMLGGQAGISGHIELGDRVKVAAKSGVPRSISPDQTVAGSPAMQFDEFFRSYANILRLPRMRDELHRLKNRVQKLEEALKDDDGRH
ncbi:MAG: UDP-3-O-(3-hydroxymyristoyl)glucosamine N-acyltransferase [Desulfobacteraceae bacterium]|nr:UDP-3-O-(3-hydroxymyristoyl)glucosamine N-acyltransferase [Desulfobacteraceae bacterium]